MALKHKDEEISLLGSKLNMEMNLVGLDQTKNCSNEPNLNFLLKENQQNLKAAETAFLNLSKRYDLVSSENKVLKGLFTFLAIFYN